MALRFMLALVLFGVLGVCACADDEDPEGASGQPGDLPTLALPWGAGETWFLVGGPHCDSAGDSCGSDEPRYALDFSPFAPIYGNLCSPSEIEKHWVTAAVPGTVRVADRSLVEIEHAGGLRTGYYHVLTSSIAVEAGQMVAAGDRLGHPSCEHLRGGASRGPHVHFYVCRPEDGPGGCLGEGESLLPADSWELAGWRIKAGRGNYEGTLERGDDVRTAINQRCDGTAAAPAECDGIRNNLAAP